MQNLLCPQKQSKVYVAMCWISCLLLRKGLSMVLISPKLRPVGSVLLLFYQEFALNLHDMFCKKGVGFSESQLGT